MDHARRRGPSSAKDSLRVRWGPSGPGSRDPEQEAAQLRPISPVWEGLSTEGARS